MPEVIVLLPLKEMMPESLFCPSFFPLYFDPIPHAESNSIGMEYLSAIFILSYFFIHNIFLVLIGIIFSLYLININLINKLIGSIDKNLLIEKYTIALNKSTKITESNPINIESKEEDTKLTLVETIEELGFIPSVDKNDEPDAA